MARPFVETRLQFPGMVGCEEVPNWRTRSNQEANGAATMRRLAGISARFLGDPTVVRAANHGDRWQTPAFILPFFRPT